MALIIKVIATALILFCGYWLLTELLWEDGKVSDKYRECINEMGSTIMAVAMVGGIVFIFGALIHILWTEI